MWDNATLLRGIASVLMAFSVLAVLYGAGHYLVHRPELLPIHSVKLSAKPERLDAAQVREVVRSEVRGNFFTVDIEHLRQALQKLPWVRTVSIRRTFPGSLAVEFEEHQPLARWNGESLVNTQGEVFTAETEQALPEFVGFAGSSAEMAVQYEKFSQQLKPLDLQVKQLVLSPRHAWQMHLSNEMVVELGRDELQQRLARFVTVYPYSLGTMQEAAAKQGEEVEKTSQRLQVQYVDMRYHNGFAVRVRHGSA
ncbi:MAG: cell division protein FtsQ/DivIB [Gallionella sp.]|nr:cell division protein FtsQ/DivIB [Gallionella sp.]MDD4946312.1 cell division protein FtsQ/DivIB [Gallionella sp.]MDD5612340.1 cell division protein FtsQ/DivIB [Gallionella sp.]